MVFKNMSSEPIKYKNMTKSEVTIIIDQTVKLQNSNKTFLNNKFWSQVPLRKQSGIPLFRVDSILSVFGIFLFNSMENFKKLISLVVMKQLSNTQKFLQFYLSFILLCQIQIKTTGNTFLKFAHISQSFSMKFYLSSFLHKH